MSWKCNPRFTSATSRVVAAILIIGAFPATFLVADLIRAQRFCSALDFTAIAVEEDGRRYAIPPTNFAEIAELHANYAYTRDRYFTLIGGHEERVICYYEPYDTGDSIFFVPKDLRTNACLGRIVRSWPKRPAGGDPPAH
jgi:hypothetical protein